MGDSTQPEAQDFFEGTEKLLELWFTDSAGTEGEGKGDLREIQRSDWEALLKNVSCEIISETRDKDMVAYVLSESSMFVSKNRFILKTCGRTTLLKAVRPLLELARTKCGMDTVQDVFYSRKKFQRPELQHKVHQNFEDEVALLDGLFENGAAYALGRLNGECWYLYTIDNVGVHQPDQTLEDLDPAVMHIFTQAASASAEEATVKSGIASILPGMVIDDFLFEPCGYSMNGILPNGQYITIHVTPEPHCSYVSFETNFQTDTENEYHNLIRRVIDIFRPGHFLMTIFANKTSTAREIYRDVADLDYFKSLGYKRDDHQFCQFKNYNLTYTHYQTPNARGMPHPPPPI